MVHSKALSRRLGCWCCASTLLLLLLTLIWGTPVRTFAMCPRRLLRWLLPVLRLATHICTCTAGGRWLLRWLLSALRLATHICTCTTGSRRPLWWLLRGPLGGSLLAVHACGLIERAGVGLLCCRRLVIHVSARVLSRLPRIPRPMAP